MTLSPSNNISAAGAGSWHRFAGAAAASSGNFYRHMTDTTGDDMFGQLRAWVLRYLPEDTASWIATTIAIEDVAGRHAGRLDSPLAVMADRCYEATGHGGVSTRHLMIQRWDNDNRLDFYQREIAVYRPLIADYASGNRRRSRSSAPTA